MRSIVEHLDSDDDGTHRGRMRIHDVDAVHAGFALALLRARWHQDGPTARLVLGCVPLDELTRSAVSLAVYLSEQSFGEATRGRSLHGLATVYQGKGRVRMALLCRDLASAPLDASTVVVHVVDIMTIIDLCSVLIAAVEADQEIPADVQFERYETGLAGAAQRRAG